MLVLSVFPGIDLLGRAFELEGFTLLRGPDILWGGDIHNFHPPGGVFTGVIGGPPCKSHSTTRTLSHTTDPDLIPEFLRVVEEAKPKWAVMENVRGVLTKGLMPSTWSVVRLRDWDCGGFTFRVRYFWIWPATLILEPPKRPGKPEYSVLASSWKNHNGTRVFRGISHLSVEQAASLMGFPELTDTLKPLGAHYAIQLLGNGVPKVMGTFIASAIKHFLQEE